MTERGIQQVPQREGSRLREKSMTNPKDTFVPPADIVAGSEEDIFHRQRYRFLKMPYDLAEVNSSRAYAAFRGWTHRNEKKRDVEKRTA